MFTNYFLNSRMVGKEQKVQDIYRVYGSTKFGNDYPKGVESGYCTCAVVMWDGCEIDDENSLDISLKKAHNLYFKCMARANKTPYILGFIEGVKIYINQHREAYYLQGFSEDIPLPGQEFDRVYNNKKADIEYTQEDDRLIYDACGKYTKGFSQLPVGYTKDDILQEAKIAWVKRLIRKGGHDPAKGKKSTLLYRVVQNRIQDVYKAVDTDKRKVIKNAVDFEDIYDGQHDNVELYKNRKSDTHYREVNG